jgi:hypothetical protein
MLGLGVLGPVLLDPTGRLAGEAYVDSYGTWWFQWWVAHSLARGESPMHADVLFFPWGKDILRHTGGNVLDVALIAPIRWLFGAGVAWNTLVFGAVVTNALAAAAWARRLGAGRATTLAAQVLVGLHPFVLDELRHGRPTQAILAPLLLALAHGDDALQGGSRRALLLSAGWLAIAAWIYWYAASFGALALCALAIGRPLLPRLARLTAIGAGSIVLTAPMLIPLATSLARGEIPGLLPISEWISGNASFVTAEGASVQVSALGLDGHGGLLSASGWLEGNLVLGVVTLLPLFALPRRFVMPALLALAIALGPFPEGTRNPVYLALADLFPPYERLYWPIRAVAVLTCLTAVGVAVGLARLPERLRAGGAAALVGAALLELVARGGGGVSWWRADVPPALSCLEGAGIVLPYGEDQIPLVWQASHEQPVLNGMAERSVSQVPAEQRAIRADNGWLRLVLRLPADPRAEIAWTNQEKQAIHDLGYRWVLLRADTLVEPTHRAAPKGRQREALRALREPLGAPVFQAEDIVIYAPWGGLEQCAALAGAAAGGQPGDKGETVRDQR